MARKRCFDLVQLAAIVAVTFKCVMTRSCPKESYTIHAKNEKLCRPCPSCSPGKGLVTPCDTEVYRNVPIDCRLCLPGKTFSSDTSKLQCQPCKSTMCHRNEKVDGVCNRKEDSTSCTGTCNNNYYLSNNYTEACQPCSYCGSTGNATKVKKCVDDGMPLHMQCENKTDNAIITKKETPAMTKTISTNLSEILPTTKSTQPVSGTLNVNRSLSTSKTNGSKGESPSGTTLAITVTIIVLVLVIIVLVLWIKCPRCRRCFKDDDAEESVGSQYQEVYHCGDVGNNMTESEQSYSERCEIVDELSENIHDNRDLEDECDLPDVGTPSNLEESSVRNGDKQAESNLGETSLLIKQFSNSPVELETENEQEPSSSTLSPLQIGCLRADVFEKICQKLNQECPGKDWRTMAGKMGYTADDVATFSQVANTRHADAVLHDWRTKTGNNLNRLLEILKEMERDDVVKIIEDSLKLLYADR